MIEVAPLVEIGAVGREYLDAVVLAVRDQDAAVGGDPDAVRRRELAGSGADPSPAAQVFAIRREAMDMGIAIAVADVDIATRRDCNIGRMVERQAKARVIAVA
jgi:hypothetical protein